MVMGTTFVSMGISLDGYVAGPDGGPGNPLGTGGMRIHQWVYGLAAWREPMGLPDGRTGQDDDVVRETKSRPGAHVIGRNMFDEGEIGWPDPPPFHLPVFVVTTRPREPWVRKGGTTFHFVTEGVERAVELAGEAAGDRDVQVSGGASTVRQAIAAGLVDDLQLHVAPLLLGEGLRLFDAFAPAGVTLVPDRVIGSPGVTHVRYRLAYGPGGQTSAPASTAGAGGSAAG
ncbi:deaminase [Pseudonocardia sp. CNS-139]|nr:deaminase [Pseudonocardia sp. CNS-139]